QRNVSADPADPRDRDCRQYGPRPLGTGATGSPGARLMRRTFDAYPTLVLVLGLLVLWQILFWLVGRNALLPPVETVLYLARLLQTARVWGHIAETGTAFMIALLVAIIAGVTIGLVLGINRT